MKAKEVAQQFGSAFASAGKLAGKLVRGFVDTPGQSRGTSGGDKASARSEARSSSSAEHSGEAGEEAAIGEQGSESPSGAPHAGAQGAALAAFKRANLRKARKKLRKQAEASSSVGLERHEEDDEELDGHLSSSMRTFLRGNDSQLTQYDQARHDALFLEELERQGEQPVGLLRHLNEQLVQDHGDDYRGLLSGQVRPQMEALAGRVGEHTSPERRMIAALVSRAATQVGLSNAVAFEGLLTATGATEARVLAEAERAAVGRANELARALRAGGSPTYRHALVENAQDWVRPLAKEWLALGPEQEQVTGALLRASEMLEPRSVKLLAEAFVSGLRQSQRPDAATVLASSVAQGLGLTPGGTPWVVQLIVTLKAQGDEAGARALAEALTGALRKARERCVPGFSRLKNLKGVCDPEPQPGAEWKDFERSAVPLAAVLPGCMQVLGLKSTLRPLSPQLTDEALVCLGSLDVLGVTSAGQRVLRLALVAQEQGLPAFLSDVPRESLALAQPAITGRLSQSGLFVGHYLFGGMGFLQRVASRTARALVGPVLARTQKGDTQGARILLRQGLLANAALFGFSSDGARRVVEMLEPLRAKPNPTQLKRTMGALETMMQEFPSDERNGNVESLRVLVSALAMRVPRVVTRGEVRRVTVELTALDVVAGQSALRRGQIAQQAPAPTPPPQAPTPRPPPGASKPRK